MSIGSHLQDMIQKSTELDQQHPTSSSWQSLKSFDLTSHATDQMLEILKTAHNLEEINLLHCKYVEGVCLGNLASKKLRTISLSGCYNIEPKYLLEATSQNKESLTRLRLDGENMSKDDVIKLL